MEFRVYRQWQELSPAVGAGVEALLEEAFPAEERRDMEEVRQLLGKTSLELLTLEEEDRVQGLLMLWNLEGLMFLENFAVDAGLRGRGIGARMLEYVWEHWKKPMLLEVEPPEGDMQRRRIGFYERNGFCLNAYPYQMPCLHGDGPALPLLPELPAISDITCPNQFAIPQNIFAAKLPPCNSKVSVLITTR